MPFVLTRRVGFSRLYGNAHWLQDDTPVQHVKSSFQRNHDGSWTCITHTNVDVALWLDVELGDHPKSPPPWSAT